MDSKPKVVLNCRSAKSILPALQKALQGQSISFELCVVESSSCPSRLSQINENRLHFFFDEDTELPHSRYLEAVTKIFDENPELLFMGGKYLSYANQPYLAKAYNSQIEFWLSLQGSEKKQGLIPCQNLPGGAWIVSGKIKKHLEDWAEPKAWAGEDTFAIRWLQKKKIQIFYHAAADVLHDPRSDLLHFCKRAFLQGKAREKFNLRSQRPATSWSFLWENRNFWAGWSLHQLCVELGSLFAKIQSLNAKTTPIISPKA